MCLHGVYKMVEIINSNQNKNHVAVDACIADEIKKLNEENVITLSCCCGHGSAGQIVEWENGFGKWKGYQEPPHALISEYSVLSAKKLGYLPYPYYYADGTKNGVWKIQLKSGCISVIECKEWHKNNKLPFVELVGIME